jgi:triosephosphate isomerase
MELTTVPTRKPFVGGNWKMNLHRNEAIALAGELAAAGLGAASDVAIFPAFPYLLPVAQVLCEKGSPIKLGAQDCYFESNGAFTGEVSLSMLKDCGVAVVLIGHSERRHVIGESDVLINRKVRASLAAGFEVILAVGEKLEQREAGMTDAVNVAQCAYGLAGVTAEQMAQVTIAYEPVWAIGTGKTASTSDAQNAHAVIRAALAGWYGRAVADSVRIQYGGSVKPDNAAELFAQPDIDGGLIGGASLKTKDFAAIVNAAK